MILSNNFQFLNNIIRVFTHFFIHTNNVTRTTLSNGVFKEPFSNVVLVTLFVFSEIRVNEKICENTCNVV